ncbi:unknown protein [Microcystis aeruginosa NIES-843]|uniref:Uncharacterized protein n=1 Tax=Microcystis aeruginosa (strain NIES-843 / IAM M-2473) TaxID=449447 RepID=B0JUR9_MICAN|nr:unknown protein [Microcystis aeruginosa NIES-843]
MAQYVGFAFAFSLGCASTRSLTQIKHDYIAIKPKRLGLQPLEDKIGCTRSFCRLDGGNPLLILLTEKD